MKFAHFVQIFCLFSCSLFADTVVHNGLVNVITGQYVESALQIRLNGPIPMALTRNYIGLDNPQGGRPVTCWSMGESYLERCGSSIVVTEPDGSCLSYAFDGDLWRPCLNEAWSHASLDSVRARELSCLDEGHFVLKCGNGDELHFESPEVGACLPLRAIESAGGHRIDFEYEDGRLLRISLLGGGFEFGESSIVASDGQRVDYTIDPETRLLTKVSRPGFPDIEYQYQMTTHTGHANNRDLFRLEKRIEGENYLRNTYYDPGDNWIGDQKVRVRRATCDGARVEHPVIHSVKEQFAPVGPNGEEVSIARYFYNFCSCHRRTSAGLPGSTRVFDADNNLTLYHWTHGHRLTSIERYQGSSDLLMIERYVWSTGGELMGKVVLNGAREPILAVTFERDASGNLIEERLYGNLSGHCSIPIELGPDGLPIENGVERAPQNRIEQFAGGERLGSVEREYGIYHPITSESWLDANGEKLCTLHAEYDEFGRLVCEKGGIEIEYDRANRPVAITVGSRTTRREYTPKGQVAREENWLGVVTSYEYNALGHLTALSVKEKRREFVRDLFGNLLEADGIKHRYTVRGQIAESIYPDGTREIYEYDLEGRLIRKVDRLGLVTRATYDELGRLLTIREEGGKELSFTYDGDLVVSTFDGQLETFYDYDAAGQLIATRCEDRYYNALVKPVHQVADSPKPQAQCVCGEVVNADGELVEQITLTDSLGNQEIQLFDIFGRLVRVTKLDPKGTAVSRVDYGYDDADLFCHEMHSVIIDGRLVGCHPIQYRYGVGGRLVSIEGEGKTRFEYSDRGLCSAKILPDGSRTSYEYDERGRLVRDGEYHYTYDRWGNLVEATGNEGTTLRTFNRFGELTSESLANGLTLHYQYDLAGRLVSTRLPDDSLIEYEYDEVGVCCVKRTIPSGETYSRILEKRDGLGRPLLERAGSLEWTYNWNEWGQQTQRTDPAGATRMEYDEIGRLVTSDREGVVSRYSYDSLSQLTKESGEFDGSFSYDSLGRRREALSHDLICDYDSRGRIRSLGKGGERWEFTYDAFDRRIEERHYTEGGQERTEYLYQGEIEIGRFSESMPSELRLLMADGASRPRTIAIEIGSTPYLVSTSERGDLVALFDLDGSVAEELCYSAFGTRRSSGAGLTPWGFSGKRHDASGLVYFGRRYYSPSLGQWLTPDPVGFQDGPNLFCYCHNNPFLYLDWLGESSEEASGEGRPLFDPSEAQRWDLLGPHVGRSNEATLSSSLPPIFGLFYFGYQGVRRLFGSRPKGFDAPEQRFITGGAAMLQIAGGLSEVGVGAALSLLPPPSPLVGGILLLHGFDHAFAGGYTLLTGRSTETLTSRMFHSVGFSPNLAEMTDVGVAVLVR